MARSAPWERDGTADDLDEQRDDESDEDFEKRLAAFDADGEDEEASGDEDEEASDPNVAAILTYIGAQEELKSAQAAERDAFNATVEENLPDYRPPADEPTDLERAAIEVARFPPGSPEFEGLKARLAEANEALWKKARANEPGFDAEGEEVLPPFDPSTLQSTEDFNIFVRAVSSGGSSPRETPQGFTRDSWAQAVRSALVGKG